MQCSRTNARRLGWEAQRTGLVDSAPLSLGALALLAGGIEVATAIVRARASGSYTGPSDPAAYSSSGTASFAHARSTGVTTRQDSSASSARIASDGSPLSTSSNTRP